MARVAVVFGPGGDRRLVTEYLQDLGHEALPWVPSAPLPEADLFVLEAASARRVGEGLLDRKRSGSLFLPVLVILGEGEVADPWLERGFDATLRTPLRKAELKAQVEVLLRLRRQSELLLQQGEERYRAIFESTGTATLLVAEDHTIVMANRECLRVTGYAPEELVGTSWIAYVFPESLPMMLRYHELRRKDPASVPNQYEAVLMDKAGRKRYAYLSVGMIPGTSESIVSLVDITEKVEAQEAVRRHNERLTLLLQISTRLAEAQGIPDLCSVVVEGARQLLGDGSAAAYLLEGETLHLVATSPALPEGFPVHLADAPLRDHPHIARALGTRSPVVLDDTLTTSLSPAEEEVVRLRGLRSLLYLPLSYQGKALGILIVGSVGAVRLFSSEDQALLGFLANQASLELEGVRLFDENRRHLEDLRRLVAEEARTRKALEESEVLFRELFHKHSAVKLLIDPRDGRIVDANEAALRFYRWSREEMVTKTLYDINTLPPPQVQAAIEEVVQEGNRYFEFRHRTAGGSVRDVAAYSTRIRVGDRVFLHSIIHDITERKRAEAERERLQDQLLQAQKLESVGRLAAGVAHDFNNMLGIILGYGEMLLDTLHPDDPIRSDVEQMVEAGRRSAELTRQLLAFSRKQTLQPELLSLNRLVRNLERMLRRMIGEDILLELVLAEEDPKVLVDPSQMEQAILNLAVNARDAMPHGGTLLIETAETYLDEEYARTHQGVIPGRYALIAITDTGVGMSKEVLAQIFDPFFTTKEKGKGTGLGLATVYGIVKQSGGYIWAYSEPGRGSTFKIYLPSADNGGEVRPDDTVLPREKRWGKGQPVLVVEDEEGVRNLVRALLERMGFQVSVAANGGEAILLVEEKGFRPVLVLTDVVMPAMSGRQVVERLRKSLPDLKVLYMSGYTDNAIVHHGVLDPGTPFLQKPFSAEELARKLREVLSGEPGGAERNR